MSDKRQYPKWDLSIFENNGKSEFVQVLKKNRQKSTKVLNDFLTGVKNEAADTKEATRIIVKYIASQQISQEEEKHLKTQVSDLFKILGIGIPFMIIPGATLLIPFIVKAAERKGIDLIPSNFKSNNDQNQNKKLLN